MKNAILPPARAYFVCAHGHMMAANIVHQQLIAQHHEKTEATWIALQNVIGFAVENALKSYLCLHGVPRPELKNKFGHNLSKLLNRCIDIDLKDACALIGEPHLVGELQTYVDLCGPDYTSFEYRYLEGAQIRVLEPNLSTRNIIIAVNFILSIIDGKIKALDETEPLEWLLPGI